MHKELQIIYGLDAIPYGIRDEHGFLFMFPQLLQWPNQKDRYIKESAERVLLAEFLLSSLQGRVEDQGEAVQTVQTLHNSASTKLLDELDGLIDTIGIEMELGNKRAHQIIGEILLKWKQHENI